MERSKNSFRFRIFRSETFQKLSRLYITRIFFIIERNRIERSMTLWLGQIWFIHPRYRSSSSSSSFARQMGPPRRRKLLRIFASHRSFIIHGRFTRVSYVITPGEPIPFKYACENKTETRYTNKGIVATIRKVEGGARNSREGEGMIAEKRGQKRKREKKKKGRYIGKGSKLAEFQSWTDIYWLLTSANLATTRERREDET